MACIYTGCNILFYLPGQTDVPMVFRGDAHCVDCLYVFNINAEHSLSMEQARYIDYVVCIREGLDSFWLESSPNVVVVNPACVYEMSDEANDRVDELENGINDMDWVEDLLGLGFEQSEDGWRYGHVKEAEHRTEPKIDPRTWPFEKD